VCDESKPECVLSLHSIGRVNLAVLALVYLHMTNYIRAGNFHKEITRS
jgi:hypothetical protein